MAEDRAQHPESQDPTGDLLPTITIATDDASALPAEALLDAAYSGAPQGTCNARADAGSGEKGGLLRVAVLLRPRVPMSHLVAVAPVSALGALDALGALGADEGSVGIGWPHDLVVADGTEVLGRIGTKAGYAEGTFVVLSLDLGMEGLSGILPYPAGDDVERIVRALRDAICRRVDSWAEGVTDELARVAPWASFLPEYFDQVALMGKPVDVRYPNGTVYARGYFVGVDIWGRATVRTKRAGDIEFPSERFGIFPQTGA